MNNNSGLLERLKNSSKHYKTTKFPGTDETICLKVLTVGDLEKVSTKLNEKYKGIKIDVANLDDYSADRESLMLFFAIVHPDTKKQLFTLYSDYSESLTMETKEVLAEELDNLHDEYSPDLNTISDKDFNELLANVKKNVNQTLGAVFNIDTLKKLVRSLVNPQTNLPTGNGSISSDVKK